MPKTIYGQEANDTALDLASRLAACCRDGEETGTEGAVQPGFASAASGEAGKASALRRFDRLPCAPFMVYPQHIKGILSSQAGRYLQGGNIAGRHCVSRASAELNLISDRKT